MEKALALPGGVYNFGSENDFDLYQTALACMEALGLSERAKRLILPDEETGTSLAMDTSLLRSNGIVFETTAEGFYKMAADYRG